MVVQHPERCVWTPLPRTQIREDRAREGRGGACQCDRRCRRTRRCRYARMLGSSEPGHTFQGTGGRPTAFAPSTVHQTVERPSTSRCSCFVLQPNRRQSYTCHTQGLGLVCPPDGGAS